MRRILNGGESSLYRIFHNMFISTGGRMNIRMTMVRAENSPPTANLPTVSNHQREDNRHQLEE